MKKTSYFCDVCEKETEKQTMFLVKMAIHTDKEVPVKCSLDVCEECLKETGFVPSHGNSYNNNKRTEQGYSIWLKWFTKAKKRFI